MEGESNFFAILNRGNWKNMIKLSSTSALVLLWLQQECFSTKTALEYLNQLDMEEGEILYEQCHAICPYYSEVIKNRKFGVLNSVKKYFDENPRHRQLVIAAAGLDALGIEITELYPVVKVFELDSENMNIKSDLLSAIGGGQKRNIKFIQTNLLDYSGVRENLITNGWDPAEPTLLIFEGISYYLTVESTQKLFEIINPQRIVLEFLKHDDDIAFDRVAIPKKVFRKIAELCTLPDILQYKSNELDKHFRPYTIIDKYGMTRLEKMRTGANKYFPSESSGWIDICVLEYYNKGRNKLESH